MHWLITDAREVWNTIFSYDVKVLVSFLILSRGIEKNCWFVLETINRLVMKLYSDFYMSTIHFDRSNVPSRAALLILVL